jgi:hypothetical protein
VIRVFSVLSHFSDRCSIMKVTTSTSVKPRIEAGSRVKAGSRIQAGVQVNCTDRSRVSGLSRVSNTPGASTEGGVDAACVQFGSGGKEFCRQGGKCPERLRYMRGGGKGGLRPPPAGGSTPLEYTPGPGYRPGSVIAPIIYLGLPQQQLDVTSELFLSDDIFTVSCPVQSVEKVII